MTGETPKPLGQLRSCIEELFRDGDVDAAHLGEYQEAVAALAQVEALAEAAQALLCDDDMPNHWDDCVCSYCVRNRALRAALVPFAAHKDTNHA